MLKNEKKQPIENQPKDKADETTQNTSSDADKSADNNKQQHQDENNENEANAQTEQNQQSKDESESTSGLDADTKDLVIADLNEKNKELNDKYLRLFSEFDNFRKRSLKERIELTKTASAEMTEAVLPVLDDLERAYKSAVENPDIVALTEGVNLILSKLKTTLRNKGLEEIPTRGELFDTDFHEAITNVPAPTEEDKGKVIDEVQKGYMLNGKVIRFAKVVVAN